MRKESPRTKTTSGKEEGLCLVVGEGTIQLPRPPAIITGQVPIARENVPLKPDSKMKFLEERDTFEKFFPIKRAGGGGDGDEIVFCKEIRFQWDLRKEF